jgi:hypothetical protein
MRVTLSVIGVGNVQARRLHQRAHRAATVFCERDEETPTIQRGQHPFHEAIAFLIIEAS